MQRTQHGQFLTQLTRFPRLFPMNCFFVREEDGFTLIDTTIASSASEIIAAAATMGAPIRRILLTHAHSDHVGGLDALYALLPDAEVLISERDARFLRGDKTLDADEPQSKLRGGYQTCTTQPTRLLQPGDHIGSLLAIAAPGHTPGQLAFHDERDGSLIVGDAFQTRGGVAVSGTVRPFFPFPALATWDKPTALATARALRALAPTLLAVGHGPALPDPLQVMDQAIAEAERRLGGEVKYGH